MTTKMMGFSKIVLAVLIYVTSFHAFSASFDCAKAGSKTEKLICSDVELSSLDENLNVTYKKAYNSVTNRSALRQSQRNWLVSEQLRSCDNAGCLKRYFSERIESLKKISVDGEQAWSSTASCVKVRDGTDGTGTSEGYTCMKFSEAQKKAAVKMRLQLTNPYDVVWSQLKKDGWKLDSEWLREIGPQERSRLPICGQGWDAICHIQVAKGGERILLVFSGANAGTPLIAIETP